MHTIEICPRLNMTLTHSSMFYVRCNIASIVSLYSVASFLSCISLVCELQLNLYFLLLDNRNNFNLAVPLVSAIVHSIFACDRHFSHAGIVCRSIDQTWTSAYSATCVLEEDARTPWDRTSVSRRRPSNVRPIKPARQATNGIHVQTHAQVLRRILFCFRHLC